MCACGCLSLEYLKINDGGVIILFSSSSFIIVIPIFCQLDEGRIELRISFSPSRLFSTPVTNYICFPPFSAVVVVENKDKWPFIKRRFVLLMRAAPEGGDCSLLLFGCGP